MKQRISSSQQNWTQKWLWCALAVAAVPTVAADSLAAERPNVIVIMPDDQGYGDHGITGNTVFRTPNIDALGRASASMSDFYVCPVCSPTRASVMTGRYHYRTRVVDTFKGRSMMEPGEVTIAELLKEAGYATGVFGKWHLGDNYPMRPMDQGFDESYIHKGGGLAQPSEPIENQQRYTDPILFHNGKQIDTKGYCTDLFFDAAINFIDRCQSESKPFFIYLPPNAPHGPFHDVPRELYEYYKSIDLSPIMLGAKRDADQVARIAAMIENIDQNIGRLRQHLSKKGLAENTMVIFLVDNGPNGRRFVGPFRGSKAEVHEGGIRSPFFVHWPARLTPGVTSDRIAAHIDIMPTVLDAAGVDLPRETRVDGRSLLPLLEGKQVDWPDRHIVLQVHRGNRPIPFHHIAVRNQNWKLVHPTGFGKREMPANVPFELYDMTNDQGETKNLSNAKPEVVTKMKAAYEKWFADVSSTRANNYDPPRIVVGSDAELTSVLTPQDWRVSGESGWGTGGRWLVDVAKSGDYQAEIIWKGPIGPAKVTLTVGEASRSVQVGANESRANIDPFALEAGLSSIGVEATNTKGPQDPYHVILRRSP
jgi:arylsulfatase/arylsulfatase A